MDDQHGPGTEPGTFGRTDPRFRRDHDDPDEAALRHDNVHGADRGREADSPREIPARGWRDILLRVKSEMDKDNLSIVAAGVSFYAFLAIFPALAALISLYGLLADPADVQQQVMGMAGTVPDEARTLLEQQMSDMVGAAPRTLGISAVIAILLALWSANKGTGALMYALNIAYDERERRGLVRRTATSLGLTLAAIVGAGVAVAALIALPALAGPLGLGEEVGAALQWLRWPLLAVLAVVGLGVLYRYGPSRDRPRWRWATWGAAIATVGWTGGSALLSFYVSNFGSYNETYGSVAAVVVLLLWLWLTAYVILVGAELNCEIEHQTRRDSTEGPPKPMGQRNAYAADTLGETPP